jgi:hypothetical protein
MRLFFRLNWTRCVRLSLPASAVFLLFVSFPSPASAQGKEGPVEHPTFYRTAKIDGLSIFTGKPARKMLPRFSCFTVSRLPRACSTRSSPVFPIAIIWLRPITPASATATGLTRKNSRIPSITLLRSESLHRIPRPYPLLALHARLRRPCRLSHDLVPSRTRRSAHHPGRRCPQ